MKAWSVFVAVFTFQNILQVMFLPCMIIQFRFGCWKRHRSWYSNRETTHCKCTVQKIRNKYSQQWNCAASSPISAFMYLQAIHMLQRSVRNRITAKKADRTWEYINHSHILECRNWEFLKYLLRIFGGVLACPVLYHAPSCHSCSPGSSFVYIQLFYASIFHLFVSLTEKHTNIRGCIFCKIQRAALIIGLGPCRETSCVYKSKDAAPISVNLLMTFGWVHLLTYQLNCQGLAAEQPLPRQAVSSQYINLQITHVLQRSWAGRRSASTLYSSASLYGTLWRRMLNTPANNVLIKS